MQTVTPDDIPVVDGPQGQPSMVAVLNPRLGFEMSHLIDYLNCVGIAVPFAAQDKQGNLLNAQGQLALPAHLRPHVQIIRPNGGDSEGAVPEAEAEPEAPTEEAAE